MSEKLNLLHNVDHWIVFPTLLCYHSLCLNYLSFFFIDPKLYCYFNVVHQIVCLHTCFYVHVINTYLMSLFCLPACIHCNSLSCPMMDIERLLCFVHNRSCAITSIFLSSIFLSIYLCVCGWCMSDVNEACSEVIDDFT